ncbi:hypothetical protein, partial [Roseibium sp. RKSG952]|uniref:hypothetical protein n=1 Tax=Roseibium sp. RKSG952 TaxID=2529384 RepID=UPI0018AD1C2F
IKQVEILSALREELPDMPEVDPAHLSELRTLAQIADAMGGGAKAQMAAGTVSSEAVDRPSEAAVAPVPPTPASSEPADNPQVAQTTILAIVAEKTGYPADMLD